MYNLLVLLTEFRNKDIVVCFSGSLSNAKLSKYVVVNNC